MTGAVTVGNRPTSDGRMKLEHGRLTHAAQTDPSLVELVVSSNQSVVEGLLAGLIQGLSCQIGSSHYRWLMDMSAVYIDY